LKEFSDILASDTQEEQTLPITRDGVFFLTVSQCTNTL